MEIYLIEFFNLFIRNFLNLASPGPETALMVHNSSHYSRKVGLFTGFGIVSSTLIHKTYCFLGFGTLIAESPQLFTFIKYAGSAYLAYLGIRMFFSKVELGEEKNPYITHFKKLSLKQAFKMGFMIDILHPSASLVFITIVAATVSRTTPISIQFIYGFFLVITSLTWYTMLALCFSQGQVKKAIQYCGQWINPIMALFMLWYAFRLATIQII